MYPDKVGRQLSSRTLGPQAPAPRVSFDPADYLPAVAKLSIGIVGLPNAGKSTLFRALTSVAVPAESYPFCTIEPNVGIVAVPDPRLDRLAELVSPPKVTPAVVEFVDIAGLVEGASRGEGLGNRFLQHIREVDAIAHVVRLFEDGAVARVS